jgi:hypothetical protein
MRSSVIVRPPVRSEGAEAIPQGSTRDKESKMLTSMK